MNTFDYLVLGSGSAGLTFAMNAGRHGRVALITKKERTDSNTNWAQGGIAGVMGSEDSTALHLQDTLIAGAGLCNEEAVRILVTEGPDRVRELMGLGAYFNVNPYGELELGMEGGHSRRRIVHTADRTGREVERALVDAVRAQDAVTVLEHHFAAELIVSGNQCFGAWVLDEATGEIRAYFAHSTLIATGGAGQVYRFTTNPSIATGDGVAMAWRAGAEIANMEFIQFHPTSLYHPDAKSFLISEAVRGEGGILKRRDGTAFMADYDAARRDLAPRDIVARAIDSEIRKTGDDCVFLDVTALPADEIRAHFPTIYARCLSYGIDITTEWIPVVPAAHYACGGVRTDLYGRTSVDRLYACGEAACTGVHGANRLASNSLLEALVFGKRAADDASARSEEELPISRKPEEVGRPFGKAAAGGPDPTHVLSMRHRLQKVMQKYVGIVRTDLRLQKAADAIQALEEEARAHCGDRPRDSESLELLNMLQVSSLIIRCAQQRRESRGLNYNIDHPEAVESERHDTIVVKS